MSTSDPPALGARDFAIAAALALLATLLYGATWRESLFDDGEVFAHYFVSSDRQVWYHVLYLPLARALHPFVPGGDHLAGLEALSVLSGAVGVGAAYLAARGLGASRSGTLLAAGLLALSPSLWFFATTIELHATHFAAVAVAAAILVLGARLPFAAHLALTAVSFPLLYLTHNSGALFGLGWVLLFAFARARVGRPVPPLRSWFVVAPTLLAALVLAICAANAYQHKGFGLGTGDTFAYVLSFRGEHRPSFAFVAEEIGLAYALLLAAAALALLRREVRLPLLVAILAAAIPVTAFFVWFAFPSRGGYFSGVAFFAFLMAAQVRVEAWWRPALALAVLASWGGQGALAWQRLRAYEAAHPSAKRDEPRLDAVRSALTPRLADRRGALISLWPVARPIQQDEPRWVEIPLSHGLAVFAGPPPDPQGFSDPVLRQVGEYLASGRWIVAIDVPRRELYAPDPVADALIGGFLLRARDRFAVEEVRSGGFLFLLLRARESERG